MADTKLSALSPFTPVLTDLLYSVDDPSGTPIEGQITLTNVRDLLQANLVEVTASGQSLTAAEATSLFDLSTTWNTTGTPTALKLDVTDTASNAASNLLDLQVGGSSLLAVRKDGYVVPSAQLTILGTGTAGGAHYEFSDPGTAIRFIDGNAEEIGRIWFTSPDTANDYNSGNMFIGKESGLNFNAAFGTAAYYNTFVGARTGQDLTTATQNAGVGYQALMHVTTGGSNNAVGQRAGETLTTGFSNTIMGRTALFTGLDAHENTAIGVSAGYSITSGGLNTLLGAYAGYNMTTGDSNIVIGASTDADSATGNYQINIGNHYFHNRQYLYNTVDDPASPTNYERLTLDWATNVAQISTENGGTGTQRALAISATNIDVTSGGVLALNGESPTGTGSLTVNSGYLTCGAGDTNLRIKLAQIERGDQNWAIRSSGPELASDMKIVFSSTTAYFGTPDIGLARSAAGVLKITDGSTGSGQLDAGILGLLERSSDPSNPAEGQAVLWQSDGTGSGSDGDIVAKVTAAGATTTHYLTKTMQAIQVRVVDKNTDLSVSTNIFGNIVVPYDGTITSVHGYVDTAGTTGTTVVDVNLNGTTIMTTDKIDIETGETTSETATTQPALTTTAVTAGDILSVDVDAISTTAPKGLVVVLKYDAVP